MMFIDKEYNFTIRQRHLHQQESGRLQANHLLASDSRVFKTLAKLVNLEH